MTSKEKEEWILEQIENNPKLFGGDNGNSQIIKKYLKDFYGEGKVKNLTVEAIKASVGISRIRNRILSNNENLDYRYKYKSKCKNVA